MRTLEEILADLAVDGEPHPLSGEILEAHTGVVGAGDAALAEAQAVAAQAAADADARAATLAAQLQTVQAHNYELMMRSGAADGTPTPNPDVEAAEDDEAADTDISDLFDNDEDKS